MRFIDQTEILVHAGHGGSGLCSFRTARGRPKLGPDGGNGGIGGSVLLVADSSLSGLGSLRYRQHYRAQDGVKGAVNNRTGACGDDLRIPVPIGTVAKDAESGELFGELVTPGQELCVAVGGKRGYGNLHFVNSVEQAPRRFSPGEEGDEKSLSLELKVLADVGLVGYPNAGKSTLLRGLSAARPKVADYPFTTLVPHLGVVQFSEERWDSRTFVVADIPGLIDGASQGKGLGHDFLRHIERNHLLAFVVDVSLFEEESPLEQLSALIREVVLYRSELADKPKLVVWSKMDCLSEERQESFWKLLEGSPYDKAGGISLGLSSFEKVGLQEFKEQAWKKLSALRQPVASAVPGEGVHWN